MDATKSGNEVVAVCQIPKVGKPKIFLEATRRAPNENLGHETYPVIVC
jgi:hypothetical protein